VNHDDLVTTCTVGTGLRPVRLGELPSWLASALEPAVEPEVIALDAAAAWTVLRDARLPESPDGEAVTLPIETRPALAGKARSLITSLTSQTDRQVRPILEEGLRLLHERHPGGVSLPDELLMELLEVYRDTPAGKNPLLPLLGERGRVIARLQPDSRVISHVGETELGEDPLDPQQWRHGTTAQRVAHLRALRRERPADARELLADKAFRKERAEARAGLVQALEIGLDVGDEPLLEQLLKDRAQAPRAVAAVMLSRLPGSAFAQRAESLATQHIRLQHTIFGKARLQITPVPQTAETEQDGYPLDQDAEDAGMQRAQHLLELIPPSRWRSLIGCDFGKLVAAAARSEDGSLLHLERAALRHHDSQAAGLLLTVGDQQDSPLLGQLLALATAEARDRWLEARCATMKLNQVEVTLAGFHGRIGPAAAERLSHQLKRWAGEKPSNWELGGLVTACELLQRQRFPRELAGQIAERIRDIADTEEAVLPKAGQLRRAARHIELLMALTEAINDPSALGPTPTPQTQPAEEPA
jgi:hypothetical protein